MDIDSYEKEAGVSPTRATNLFLRELGVLHGRVDQIRARGRPLQLHSGRHQGSCPLPFGMAVRVQHDEAGMSKTKASKKFLTVVLENDE